MVSRLVYALIGALLGVFVAFVIWWILGFGIWPRGSLSIRSAGLQSLAEHLAVICAVIGFVFKDRVGTLAGTLIASVFHIRMGTRSSEPWYAPTWLVVVVLIAVVSAVWYFSR